MAALHIGELAARCGRSIHTIRWYEKQGLIPGVERDGGGRRVYSELHLGWLDLIDCAAPECRSPKCGNTPPSS